MLAVADSSDLPTWFTITDTAVGTVGTVVTTVIALFLLGQGSRDRRQVASDARRAQAARVQLGRVLVEGVGGSVGSHMDCRILNELANDSDDVITDVQLNVWVDLADPLPGEAVEAFRRRQTFPRLDPGEPALFSEVARFRWDDNTRGAPATVSWSSVTFTDSAGRRWQRDEHHALSQVKPRKAAVVRVKSGI